MWLSRIKQFFKFCDVQYFAFVERKRCLLFQKWYMFFFRSRPEVTSSFACRRVLLLYIYNIHPTNFFLHIHFSDKDFHGLNILKSMSRPIPFQRELLSPLRPSYHLKIQIPFLKIYNKKPLIFRIERRVVDV